ncbi:alpha/beta family hydrolase [Bacillus sp. FJAT-45037]|uniref:alpha/beta family hydrolase n=1 Tax=Bacillus sp. FJAT-45037 TaxID=2011007 RepID=UPI000C242AA1|nr:alpha/beta family hydrolase [Bacillus sp. FJAT-45037]
MEEKYVCVQEAMSTHLLKQEEKTNKLAIMLPGAGYTTKAPLLHFSTGLFYNEGYDILHVNYTYNQEELAQLKAQDFITGVERAVEAELDGRHYDSVYVVAKSLGTIALSSMVRDKKFSSTMKAVWLTPLINKDEVFDAMMNSVYKSLCVIGDQDPYYSKKRIDELKSHDTMTCKVIPGANHGLQLDHDVMKSIDLLKEVMEEIKKF